MSAETFEQFDRRALAAGFDEVRERRWDPGAVVETHSHEFDADAVVTAGEIWLTCEGKTRHSATAARA